MKLSRALDLFRNRLSSSVSCRAASRRRATRTAPKLSRCEPLQSRILPVVTTFADGVLTVEFDEQNEQQLIFTTGAETGELLLNGESLVASSDEVESLIIQPQPESGGGSNTIDLSGMDVVLPLGLIRLEAISVNSGTGSDVVIGSIFGELIMAGSGNQTLLGGSGNDTLIAGGGNDSLEGGRGHDSLDGGAGNDLLSGGLDNDTLDGGAGFDTLSGDTGNDVLLGGTHADLLNGGDGADLLRGHGGLDTLHGGPGNDRLYGNGSRNQLFGDDGDDVLIGGPARDRMRGGADNDTVLGFGERDHILGGPGDDLLNGGDDSDTVRGGSGADMILGRGGDDFLAGDAEGDFLDGGDGDDELLGHSGADTINGGSGDDTISSGDDIDDADMLDGGTGNDRHEGIAGPFDIRFNFESFAQGGENFTIETGPVESLSLQTQSLELSTGYFMPAVEGESDESSDDSHNLIRLDEFAADFADIDGVLPAPPSESDPEPLRVVVIDNAFDVNHPYFGAGQVVFAGSFVGVDPFGIPYDADHVNPNAAGDPDQIHGTHVASIVGSRDAVVSGVAPDVELVLLSVAGFDAASGDDTFDFADIADALEWVVANAEDMRIVSVNMSFGGDRFTFDPVFTDPDLQRWDTAFQDLNELGVIPVAAAANAYFNPGGAELSGIAYPAADSNVISVGAVYDSDAYGAEFWGSGAVDNATDEDRISSFSQRDANLLDVFAPGGSIDGALRGGGGTGADPNRVAFSGTSQAAPQVAGAVPLIQELALRELGRKLTFDEFRDLLRSTGERIFDGDDEDDNVDNTNAWYRRLDMVALGQAVIAMGANDPVNGISNAITAGIYQDDGVADQYTVRRQVDTVTVDVNGTPTEFVSPADLEIVLTTTDAQSNPVVTVIWRQEISAMNNAPVELRLQGSDDDDLFVLDFSDGDATQELPAGGNFDLVGGLTLLAGSQNSGDSLEILRGDAPNPAGGSDDVVTEVTHSFNQAGVPLTTISSSITTAVDAVTTTISVADGSLFASDQVVQVGAEELAVTAVSGNTLAVLRGQNGTAASSHAANDLLTVLTGHTVNQLRILSEEIVTAAGSTLAAAIDALTDAISVADGSVFAVSQILQIENEDVLVTAVSGNALTVERGVRGTVAAAHASGLAVVPVALQKEMIISYAGLDANTGITDRLVTADRRFQYGHPDDEIRIKDGLFGNDTFMRVETIAANGDPTVIGTPVVFAVPSAELNISGGDGNDHMIMLEDDGFFNAALILDGQSGNDSLDTVPYSENVTVLGGDGNDLLATDGGNDRLDGGHGDDTIRGGGGGDTLTGGPGNDRIRGQGGTDILVEEGDSDWTVLNINDEKAKIISSFGTDTLHSNIANDNIEHLILRGGEGANVIDVSGYTGRLINGVPQLYIPRLFGRGGDDTLIGSAADDFLFGEDGNDVIVGNDGDDRISGGNGNDHITGSGGEDTMIGLAGDDKFFGGGDNDLIIGGAGIDTLNGNSHADRMAGRGNVIGSFGIEDTGNTNADAGDILNLDGLDEVVETVTYSFQWLEA